VTILLVPVRYPPHIGGIETLLEQTVPSLRALGHEFVVVTGTDDATESSELVDGVPVHRLPFLRTMSSPTPARLLALGARFREIEEEHDIDLRHVHGLDSNLWFVVRRHRQRPLPLVVSVHGTLDPPYPYGPVTRDTFLAADVVTSVSASVRGSVESIVPELEGRITVIPNGVTVERADRPGPVPGRVLVAGRLDWLKGFDLVVRALTDLRDAHPDVHLRIAGTGHEEARLRDVARAFGVADRVELLGARTRAEVLDEIAQSTVVAVPSRAIEGFSLIALEAAHLGRPVVATAVGGLVETVVDHATGLLVPPDDHAALARAIGRLLADPARARALGEAARAHARHYDTEVCAGAYAAVYDRLSDARALVAASPTEASR
jgi:glycosyltransferase involved in cell wall biosynthesis